MNTNRMLFVTTIASAILFVLLIIQSFRNLNLVKEYESLVQKINISVYTEGPVRLTDEVWVIPMTDKTHRIIHLKEVMDGLAKQTKRKGAPKENSPTARRR